MVVVVLSFVVVVVTLEVLVEVFEVLVGVLVELVVTGDVPLERAKANKLQIVRNMMPGLTECEQEKKDCVLVGIGERATARA